MIRIPDWLTFYGSVLLIVTVVLMGGLYLQEAQEQSDKDFILEMNLKTCANMLDNGNLTHQSQRSTCAELIRRSLL